MACPAERPAFHTGPALAGSGLLFMPRDRWTIPRSILVIGGYSASFLTMPQQAGWCSEAGLSTAASATQHVKKLLTGNAKDFKGIPGLDPVFFPFSPRCAFLQDLRADRKSVGGLPQGNPCHDPGDIFGADQLPGFSSV